MSTLRRKMRAATRRISATHRICQAMASRCGHRSGGSAARASMTNGEDKGNSAPARPRVLSGSPTALAASAKTTTWAMVTGIDRVCTSRAVDAWPPMPRKTEPSSR